MSLRMIVCAAAMAATTQAAAEDLRVLNWDDYIDPGVLADFTAETGVDVTYHEYSDPEITEAFLVSGAADYHLVIISSEYFGRLRATGAIRPIDPSKLSGRERLRSDVMARFGAIEGAASHALPYMWGTTGIGYDAAAVAARMPDAPVDSWSMIFDPEILSRFADCGVGMLDSPEEVMAVALRYLGHDPGTSSPAHLEEAEALIAAVAPYIRTFDNEQTERLAQGELCVAVAWSGDVLAAAETQRGGIDIRYSVPREGAPIWFDMLVMPRAAAPSAAAYQFLNFLLRPEVIARVTNYVWYPNPNSAAAEHVDPEVLANPLVYPPEEVMERLFLTPSRPSVEKREIARKWRRLKLTI